MKGIVVDAPDALKLLRREPGHEAVRMHLRRGTDEGRPFLVPPIFWLEIVNVLTRRYRYPPPAIVEAVFELEQIGLTTADVRSVTRRTSLRVSRTWRVPARS